MSFEKSVDSFLILWGNLEVRKSLAWPFDASDIINCELSYIISYAGGLPCREDKALTP